MVKRVLMAIVLLGVASCLWVMVQRWEVEHANRTVELTAEWPELRELSAVLRVPMPELLRHFHEAGVTSVALQEQTIHELVDDGQIFRPDPFTDVRVQALMAGVDADSPRRTVLAFPDDALRLRVRSNLAIRWGADRIHPASLGAMPALVVDGDYAQFRDLGVGIDPVARAQARQAGLGVVGRIKNYAALNLPQLKVIIDRLKGSGAHVVIFSGDDVLGNPDLIHDTAADLEAAGLAYGYVEFGKQHGDDRLAAALKGQFVRVHTIQGAELSNMTPGAAIARFVKAVRERNIRLCYIHLLSSVTGGTLSGDEDFVHQIARGMVEAGYQPGISTVARPWRASRPALVLAACGLIAASALLVTLVWGELLPWMLAVLGLGLVGLAAAIGHVQAQQAAALLAALVFPTLSLVWCPLARLTSPLERTAGAPEADHRRAAQWALGMFLRTCLFSWLGALYIIGFLGSTLFMSKTNQFLGIKFAIVLPVIAIFILYGGGILEGGSAPARWARLKERFSAAMGTPLHTGQVIVFLVVVLVLAILVARSGNDSAVGASLLELKTRRLMDGILIARPRTKEVLLGHPALFLAFYAAARRWRQWIVPLVSLGAIGQTSLVNTFCHIHTPLTISLFHLINGLWLGAIIGWICCVVWDRLHLRGANGERPRGADVPSPRRKMEAEPKRNGMKRAAPIDDL